jgi:hypothetical protein
MTTEDQSLEERTKNVVYGSNDTREGKLVAYLETQGYTVKQVGISCGEQGRKWDGVLTTLGNVYNIHDGPVIVVTAETLSNTKLNELKPKFSEDDYLDRTAGYFITAVILDGSDAEIRTFKPLVEEFLTNPEYKHKGAWLD